MPPELDALFDEPIKGKSVEYVYRVVRQFMINARHVFSVNIAPYGAFGMYDSDHKTIQRKVDGVYSTISIEEFMGILKSRVQP